MRARARTLDELLDARHLKKAGAISHRHRAPSGWSSSFLAGRLVEISPARASAQLTVAFGLVVDAQRRGEFTAWITAVHSHFYPPDAAEGGVDLDALVVVRLPGELQIYKAADQLIRSGAFGLVVLDMNSVAPTSGFGQRPVPGEDLVSRLAGLARRHSTGVVLLTRFAESDGAGSPLVSIRATARRRIADPVATLNGGSVDGYTVQLQVTRDKTGMSPRNHEEDCVGPAGMC